MSGITLAVMFGGKPNPDATRKGPNAHTHSHITSTHTFAHAALQNSKPTRKEHPLALHAETDKRKPRKKKASEATNAHTNMSEPQISMGDNGGS